MSFSFRKYVLMREDHRERFASVVDKAVDLARAVRDPHDKEYIPDDSERELAVFSLEEVGKLLSRELGKLSDPDECMLKIKEFRREFEEDMEKAGESEESSDLGRVKEMVDGLLSDAAKAVGS